jgi:uncharacterized protein YkwD
MAPVSDQALRDEEASAPVSDSMPDRRSARPRRRLAQGGLGLALALVALLVVITPAPIAAWTAGTFSSASESLLVQLTNQARANAGLAALSVDSTLRTVARSRSKDMIDRNYFSHSIPPDGHKVFDELRAMGYCYVTAGENIGWNTYPDDTATYAIQDMFMGSSSHRANILGSAWRVIGVGAYQGSTDKKMWTVLFAQPCSGGGATPKPATPKPTVKPATPRPATPRPATPRPATAEPAAPVITPEPTAEPTPPPTPEPTLSPDLEAEREAYLPAWLWGPLPTAATDTGTSSPASPAPPAEPAVDRGLRVADPPVSQGIFEAILGGVTSLFFSS